MNGLPVGAWRSLVARVVRDDKVGGSNPLAPTSSLGSAAISAATLLAGDRPISLEDLDGRDGGSFPAHTSVEMDLSVEQATDEEQSAVGEASHSRPGRLGRLGD